MCDAQTRRFNQDAAGIENAKVLTISADLPFAQKRWCAANGLENVVTLSDHRDLHSVKLTLSNERTSFTCSCSIRSR